ATAHARGGRVLVARFGFAFALARRRQRMARLLAAHLTRRVVAVAETFARRTEGRVAAGVDLVAVVQADLEEANDTLALELDVAALGGPSDGALDLRGDDAAAGGAGFVARAGAQLGALDRGHLPFDFDLLAAVREVAVAGEVDVGDRHRAARGRRLAHVRRRAGLHEAIPFVQDRSTIGEHGAHRSCLR